MANQEDVRRIALALPGVFESPDGFGFFVENRGKQKALAWAWKERTEPKQPRVPNPRVIAVRVAGEAAKQAYLGAVPTVFFTEPHYNGFPAILVRLEAVGLAELEQLLLDAWRIQAPRAAVKAFQPT